MSEQAVGRGEGLSQAGQTGNPDRDLALPVQEQAPGRSPAPYLTPEQVAGMLQVSTKTVYRWAGEDPTMPQIRLGGGRGGTLRFPAARLERWLRAREGAPEKRRQVRNLMGSEAQPREMTAMMNGENGVCAVPCAAEAS